MCDLVQGLRDSDSASTSFILTDACATASTLAAIGVVVSGKPCHSLRAPFDGASAKFAFEIEIIVVDKQLTNVRTGIDQLLDVHRLN